MAFKNNHASDFAESEFGGRTRSRETSQKTVALVKVREWWLGECGASRTEEERAGLNRCRKKDN